MYLLVQSSQLGGRRSYYCIVNMINTLLNTSIAGLLETHYTGFIHYFKGAAGPNENLIWQKKTLHQQVNANKDTWCKDLEWYLMPSEKDRTLTSTVMSMTHWGTVSFRSMDSVSPPESRHNNLQGRNSPLVIQWTRHFQALRELWENNDITLQRKMRKLHVWFHLSGY